MMVLSSIPSSLWWYYLQYHHLYDGIFFNTIIFMMISSSIPSFFYNGIGFPAHFRHLFIQFHQFPIQFRPEKLTAFKSKVQFRQIVIRIRFLSIKFKNSAFKFVNCHWNSSLSLSELRIQRSNSSLFQTNSLFCHSHSSGVIGPLHLSGRRFWLKLWRKWMPIDENALKFAVSYSATVTDEFE